MKKFPLTLACVSLYLSLVAQAQAATPTITYSFRVPSQGVRTAAAPAHPVTYATWDPTQRGTGVTLSSSNLQQANFGGGWNSARATMSKSSGKWYWEIAVNSIGNDKRVSIGAALISESLNNTVTPGYLSSNSSNASPPSKFVAPGWILSNYGQQYAAGNTVSVLLDLDSRSISFYMDCANQGVAPLSLAVGSYSPFVSSPSSSPSTVTTANFGATPFKCTVPAGYSAGLF